MVWVKASCGEFKLPGSEDWTVTSSYEKEYRMYSFHPGNQPKYTLDKHRNTALRDGFREEVRKTWQRRITGWQEKCWRGGGGVEGVVKMFLMQWRISMILLLCTHDYMCKKTVRRPYMFVLELLVSKAGVSNIWPTGQNYPTKRFNLAHLKNFKNCLKNYCLLKL